MKAHEMTEGLKRIFSEILIRETVPPEQRTRLNCLHWDSLNHLKLVVAIEQDFGITLTDAEVIELNSFQTALEIVKAKLPTEAS